MTTADPNLRLYRVTVTRTNEMMVVATSVDEAEDIAVDNVDGEDFGGDIDASARVCQAISPTFAGSLPWVKDELPEMTVEEWLEKTK